jgi:hypothetical protein
MFSLCLSSILDKLFSEGSSLLRLYGYFHLGHFLASSVIIPHFYSMVTIILQLLLRC